MSARGGARALFDDEGFVILRGALRPHDIGHMASLVQEYLERNGSLLRTSVLGNNGGWIVPGFREDPNLEPIHHKITGNRKLTDFLTDLLGTHRVLARDELFIDRFASQHVDTLWSVGSSALNAYNVHLGIHRATQFYLPLANNETHRIATVAVYLQSHSDNNRSLSVKPRSHLWHPHATHIRRLPEFWLHPEIGDIVVFDARLTHAAQSLKDANYARDVHIPHRTCVSITFGRNNAFSYANERGYAMRSRLFTNRTECGNLDFPKGDCAERVIAKDIAEWDLSFLKHGK